MAYTKKLTPKTGSKSVKPLKTSMTRTQTPISRTKTKTPGTTYKKRKKI